MKHLIMLCGCWQDLWCLGVASHGDDAKGVVSLPPQFTNTEIVLVLHHSNLLISLLIFPLRSPPVQRRLHLIYVRVGQYTATIP